MEEYLNGTASELQAKIKEVKMLADKMIDENDRAFKWASEEIIKYKQLLECALKALVGRTIYWASPNWRKIEYHMITDVKLDKMESGFYGEEYKGETVIKLFVDETESYYIAEKLGENLFLNKEDAEKVAGSAEKK